MVVLGGAAVSYERASPENSELENVRGKIEKVRDLLPCRFAVS